MRLTIAYSKIKKAKSSVGPGGGHWPRKGVWGCAALKTPFSRLSCRSQGSHFKQKSQFTRPPFEKIWKFSAYKPPKLGNFQLTSPQIWKFLAHKRPKFGNFSSQALKFGNFPLTSPPFQRQMSVRKPHTSEIRAAHPYLKKNWVPPPGVSVNKDAYQRETLSKWPVRLLPLRGYCTSDQVFDCLCIFLKNYNTLITSKICFL